jgi:geranylgeranyl diphosphate synthase type II
MNELQSMVHKIIEEFTIEYTKNIEEKSLLTDIFVGGKRLRPMIALALSGNVNVDKIALAIELIHNSSLIIDDLPCMDNDLYRRNNKTIHNKYGETNALNIAIFLFTKALELIYTNVIEIDNSGKKIYEINKIIYDNIGKNGLPLGQYLDLGFLKKKLNLDNKKEHTELIYKKTTTLFNLSFLIPYILITDDEQKIVIMKKISKWFGIAFQLYDDFLDIEQDKINNSPNYINKYGYDIAYTLFHKSINKTKLYLQTLDIKHTFFNEVFELLENKVVNTKKK